MKIILQSDCFGHKFLSIQFSYKHECNSLTIFTMTSHTDFTVWSRIDPENNRIWYLAVWMVVKTTAISENKVRQILFLDSINLTIKRRNYQTSVWLWSSFELSNFLKTVEVCSIFLWSKDPVNRIFTEHDDISWRICKIVPL